MTPGGSACGSANPAIASKNSQEYFRWHFTAARRISTAHRLPRLALDDQLWASRNSCGGTPCRLQSGWSRHCHVRLSLNTREIPRVPLQVCTRAHKPADRTAYSEFYRRDDRTVDMDEWMDGQIDGWMNGWGGPSLPPALSGLSLSSYCWPLRLPSLAAELCGRWANHGAAWECLSVTRDHKASAHAQGSIQLQPKE